MLLSLIKAWGGSRKPLPVEEPRRNCITFSLHGTPFGIDTGFIKAIVSYNILAEPRGKPAFVRGLLRHQGRMLPVLDIAALYGTHRLAPGQRTCVLVATVSTGAWQCDIGLMVDEVLGLATFDAAALQPMPDKAHRMLNVDIVEGMVRQERDYLTVIDTKRLLADADIETLSKYMQLSVTG